MNRITSLLLTALLALTALRCTEDATAAKTTPKPADRPKVTLAQQIERGKFLVTIGDCNGCHTPLKMGPKGPEPDMSRMLSGHPQDLVMPTPPKGEGPWMISMAGTATAFAGPWGISYAANLTPDAVTGLGPWSEQTFINTMRTGRHWGVSRPILPPMPWQNLNTLSDDDLRAVFAYLRSVKPVKNLVPDAVIASQS